MRKQLLPFGMLFLGFLLALMSAPEMILTLRIANDAEHYVATQATVTGRFTKDRRYFPPVEVLEFSYRTDTRRYEGTNRFTRLSDTKIEILRRIHGRRGHETLEVYYDPKRPEHAVIRRDIPILWPILLLLFNAALLVVGIVMVIDVLRVQRAGRKPRLPRPPR